MVSNKDYQEIRFINKKRDTKVSWKYKEIVCICRTILISQSPWSHSLLNVIFPIVRRLIFFSRVGIDSKIKMWTVDNNNKKKPGSRTHKRVKDFTHFLRKKKNMKKVLTMKCKNLFFPSSASIVSLISCVKNRRVHKAIVSINYGKNLFLLLISFLNSFVHAMGNMISHLHSRYLFNYGDEKSESARHSI